MFEAFAFSYNKICFDVLAVMVTAFVRMMMDNPPGASCLKPD